MEGNFRERKVGRQVEIIGQLECLNTALGKDGINYFSRNFRWDFFRFFPLRKNILDFLLVIMEVENIPAQRKVPNMGLIVHSKGKIKDEGRFFFFEGELLLMEGIDVEVVRNLNLAPYRIFFMNSYGGQVKAYNHG